MSEIKPLYIVVHALDPKEGYSMNDMCVAFGREHLDAQVQRMLALPGAEDLEIYEVMSDGATRLVATADPLYEPLRPDMIVWQECCEPRAEDA